MDARLGDLSRGGGDALRPAAPQPVRRLRGAGRFKKCGDRGRFEQDEQFQQR